MIEFGKSLRDAREAKGYTVRQLAEMTRMAPTTVQDLESENFTRIAAPIYGRGFIKLYCEAVGIDPKPLIGEFMEIFNGNRDMPIRERPGSDVPTTAAEPNTVPAVEPPPPIEAPEPAPAPEPEPVQEPEPDLFERFQPAEAEHEPPLSRYAAPIRHRYSNFDIQSALKIAILAAGALVLLVLVIWGVRSVYRATSKPSCEETVAEPAVAEPSVAQPSVAQPSVTEPAAAQGAPRSPQKIPSLYID